MTAKIRRVRRFIWVNRRMILLGVFAVFMLPLVSCSSLSLPVNPKIDLEGKDLDDALDEHTDSRRDHGCGLTLLVDGDESYRTIVDLIDSARDHVNVETLNFDTDEDQPEQLGLEIAKILADKARAGIEVNVIIDAVFQKYIAKPTAVDMLREGGANVRYFMPPLRRILLGHALYRTHKKLLVADGTRAIVGGSNFGSRYLGRGQWRDTNVSLTGPVVAAIQRQFLRDWRNLGQTVENETRYFPPLAADGSVTLRAIDQRPSENAFDINQAVLIAVRSARTVLEIETPYFNPAGWLMDELRRAAARGVEVRVLTNSENSSNMVPSYWSGAYHFNELIRSGVRLHLWNCGKRAIHSKVMVVDDRLAMISSYNFSNRSILWDAENGIIVTDPVIVTRVHQMMQDDFGRDFVVRVDEDWINAQSPDARSLWGFIHAFGWLF
jgi:cardiolipin synthase A/B